MVLRRPSRTPSTQQTSSRVLVHLPTSTTTLSTLQTSASIFVHLPAAPSTLHYPNEHGDLPSTDQHPRFCKQTRRALSTRLQSLANTKRRVRTLSTQPLDFPTRASFPSIAASHRCTTLQPFRSLPQSSNTSQTTSLASSATSTRRSTAPMGSSSLAVHAAARHDNGYTHWYGKC